MGPFYEQKSKRFSLVFSAHFQRPIIFVLAQLQSLQYIKLPWTIN